ncbi:MAG: hypothetical protein WC510_01150 [Candidatus Omnitrophota bacterium]
MKSRFISKIIIVILISLSIGLIYIYPDLRFILELKNEFKGITLTATHDELGYLARIKAVYKGNPACRGIDLYEHRDALWTQPFLCELVEGSIGRLLKINVSRLDIIMSFFLPVILFWLIFILLMKLSDSKICSFLGAGSIVLGYSVFTAMPVVILKDILVTHNFSEPLWFLRPISPQFNHVVFILALVMIYSAVTHKKKKAIFFSAFFTGALFYIHHHYWTYIYAGLFILSLFFFVTGSKGSLKTVLLIIAWSLFLSLPFWLHAYKIRLSPNYLDALNFAGLINTHQPILPVFHLALSAGIIITLWFLKDANIIFITAFLAGGILCLNQQIVTGITMIPGHWQGYTNKTFLIIALAYVLFRIITRSINSDNRYSLRLFYTSLASIIVIFFYSLGFIQQNNYYYANKEKMRQRQAISGAYGWINRNAKNTDVVLTDPYNYLLGKSPFNFEVLTYTNCYTYLPMIYSSLLSKDEFEYRILAALRFFNYPKAGLDSYLSRANGTYLLGLQVLPDYGNNPISLTEVERIKTRYTSLLNLDAFTALKKYKVDYVVVENKSLPGYGMFFKTNKLTLVYRDDEFSILKIA